MMQPPTMLLVLVLVLPSLCAGDMGPLVPDTTILDGCAMDPGGAALPSCLDHGPVASAAACLAACDATPACSGVTFHGPTTGPWANHCAFRLDGVFSLRACGAGCDHASANKTSGWVPAPPPPPPTWLPTLLPWGKPKVFWFGANSSGLDSRDTLALLARHAVAGYGWQTGHAGGGTVGTGEMLQAAAATHLADYLNEVGNNATTIFEYRQIQVALRLFAASALAADNPANEDFWLHDTATGALCVAGQPWGTQDPFWNFTSDAASDYWINTVIGELAMDAALRGGRGALFFDESDQGECGYRGSNCDFAAFNATALQASKNAVYARQVKAMNAAGLIPILSLDNRFTASGAGLSAAMPCALPEEALADALAGTTWVRFYETFPNTFWAPSVDVVPAMIANAIVEAQAGIPAVLHMGGACPAPQRNITRPGPLGGDIEWQMALYLTVAGPGTTISISSNWYDADYCWHNEFDIDFGAPLSDAVRTGRASWARNYTRSTVTVDASTHSAVVMLLD